MIEIGGTASGTTVSGGSEIVSAGGTATAAMIGPGGVEIVTDGGLDVGATIAGGTQDITGLAIGAQIASSGSAMVSAGGAMVSATLAATGSAFVLSGGLAIATLVDPAATLITQERQTPPRSVARKSSQALISASDPGEQDVFGSATALRSPARR